jgi:hypothetical protein
MTEPVRSLLTQRQQAYARVFAGEGRPEDAKLVLDDLVRFSHFGRTAFHPDQRMTDVLIGRQEVLHRILDYAKLSPDELYVKYSRDQFNPRKD